MNCAFILGAESSFCLCSDGVVGVDVVVDAVVEVAATGVDVVDVVELVRFLVAKC